MRTSPLDARHRALGAKLVPFGGWEMPIQYRSVLDEHRACREDAAVFDVSHLGTRRVRRPERVRDAAGAARRTISTGSRPGAAQYTHLLDAADAHVVDDIIVWWVEPERFFVMPNASNTDRLARGALQGSDGSRHHRHPCRPRRAGSERAGQARHHLAGRGRGRRAFDVACGRRVDRRGHRLHGRGRRRDPRRRGRRARAVGRARPVPASRRPVSARATRCGSRPGCRCTATSSAPASRRCRPRLGWVVRWDKGPFRGRDALEREKEAGPRRLLAGSRSPAGNPAARARSCCHGGQRGRRRHERQLLADARSCHRARVPRRRTSSPAPRSRSTCAASRCRRPS